MPPALTTPILRGRSSECQKSVRALPGSAKPPGLSMRCWVATDLPAGLEACPYLSSISAGTCQRPVARIISKLSRSVTAWKAFDRVGFPVPGEMTVFGTGWLATRRVCGLSRGVGWCVAPRACEYGRVGQASACYAGCRAGLATCRDSFMDSCSPFRRPAASCGDASAGGFPGDRAAFADSFRLLEFSRP
jgi:hypothetical protein